MREQNPRLPAGEELTYQPLIDFGNCRVSQIWKDEVVVYEPIEFQRLRCAVRDWFYINKFSDNSYGYFAEFIYYHYIHSTEVQPTDLQFQATFDAFCAASKRKIQNNDSKTRVSMTQVFKQFIETNLRATQNDLPLYLIHFKEEFLNPLLQTQKGETILSSTIYLAQCLQVRYPSEIEPELIALLALHNQPQFLEKLAEFSQNLAYPENFIHPSIEWPLPPLLIKHVLENDPALLSQIPLLIQCQRLPRDQVLDDEIIELKNKMEALRAVRNNYSHQASSSERMLAAIETTLNGYQPRFCFSCVSIFHTDAIRQKVNALSDLQEDILTMERTRRRLQQDRERLLSLADDNHPEEARPFLQNFTN